MWRVFRRWSALLLLGFAGCAALTDFGGGRETVLHEEAAAFRSDELKPRLNRRRASNLPAISPDGQRGLRLTDWLDLEVSTAYREQRWAVGYTVLRLFGVLPLSGDLRTRAFLELSGGAGAGLGGNRCIESNSCAQRGDGPRWYEGVALGWFVAAGAGLRHRWFALVSTLRLEIVQTSALPEAYRFLAALSAQLELPLGLKLSLSGGYVVDWAEDLLLRGPTVEVGVQQAFGLFGR